MNAEELRPVIIQRQIERLLPGIWDYAQLLRQDKGKALPDWPDWCFIPITGWLGATQVILGEYGEASLETSALATHAAAVGTWRISKGIYRFDEDLYVSLINTPIAKDTPISIFFRLPELCVYVETPGFYWKDSIEVYGFFAFLEHDEKNGHDELRLLVDSAGFLFPIVLHLNENDVISGLQEIYAPTIDKVYDFTAKLLSMLLYLCSDEPDYGDRQPPMRAIPQKVKGGEKWFAAPGVKTWDVGVRIGAAIRKYRHEATDTEKIEGAGTGRSVRPHIRRAHWHGFWKGSRKYPEKRRFILHWIPPIPVKMSDTNSPAPVVIRPVKE